ncbi:uncharacterized protein TNCV_3830301 [Trichonephila clavipes]|nr:uncharacterized protein TNCV_3830301 [Trichonephila clavipes]
MRHVKLADEIDISANIELTQTRHRVQRRNVNFNYEARDDQIEDPTLKYIRQNFIFSIRYKAINALEPRCIVPSRHGGTLNSCRAANPLVRLVEGKERWEAPDHPQDVLSLNWGETELNRSVPCTVLKATANDRRQLSALL